MTKLLALFVLHGCAGTPPATPSVPMADEEPEPIVAAPAEAAPAIDCPMASVLEVEPIREEIECLLTRYVQLDTTNPPGNEVVAATFVQQVLARDGIEARILESEPGRANVIARIEGAQDEGAIVLMHHMDVVPAEADQWSVPPLSGIVDDGFLYGRGSLDNKGAGVMQIVSVALLKRLDIVPPHDVIVLGVADEEAGGGRGARWLVDAHRDLFEGVGAVLNEGGAILEVAEGQRIYSVEVAQKAPLWLRLSATGPAGHGSTPRTDAATHALVRALGRLEAHRFPLTVIDEVQTVFTGRSIAMPPAEQRRYRNLRASLRNPSFRQEFLSDPHRAVLVQNTMSITMLDGGDKENVIPGNASAVLDLRLLPGQDPAAVIAELREVIAEPSITIETLLSWEAHTTPTDTPMFAAIRQLAASRHPNVPVAPNVIGGFTDCNAFRAADIPCYGFLPIELSFPELRRIHGVDERVSLAGLAQGSVDLAALLQIDG